MAKSKFLTILTHRGSRKKSSSSKKDVTNTAPVPNQSHAIKSPEELLNLLNNFPESEIESDRELSFTFLVNSPPKENDVPGQGGKTEQQLEEATSVKENKMCRCRIKRSSFGSGRIGVLLNFHVPVPLPDSRKSRSVREIPCTTMADIQKREIKFRKFGWWSVLLRGKQDHNELSMEAVPQPAY